MCSIKYFWLLLKWTLAPDLQFHILQGSPTISFPPNMENSSNTSLGRLLINHLAQRYQNVGNLPLWIQNSRVPHLCILVYTRRQCWQCSVIGGFYKPWLYKEGIRRKTSFYFLFRAIHLSQKEGWSSIVLLIWSSARISTRMTVPINVEVKIGCVFQDAPYLTTLAEQVTSPLEEAVLQVSFPYSLAGAVLVVRIVVIFFLLRVASLFIDHSPHGSFLLCSISLK